MTTSAGERSREHVMEINEMTSPATHAAFPSEDFVVEAVDAWLRAQGYWDIIHARRGHQDPDLKAVNDNGAIVIEAKGATAAVGLDFNTGLGQLIKHMDSEEAVYAIAVPDTAQFRTQLAKVPALAQRRLLLVWLLVAMSGEVEVLRPADDVGGESHKT